MKTAIFCIITLASGVIGFLLFRPSPSPQEPTTPQEPVEVTLYHYFSGPLKGGIDAMVTVINQREKKHHLEAHALDHEAFKSLIRNSLDLGNPPQLFSYWAGAKTNTLVKEGHLAELDDLWLEAGLSQKLKDPVVSRSSQYNGHHYLLPIMQHVVVFFYNSHLFKELSITPPGDWQEFLQVADQLKKGSVSPIALGARERWPAQFWFDYLLLRTAGPEFRAALMRGEASYTDQRVKDVFHLWSSLIKKGYFNQAMESLDWAEAADLLCTQQAGMTLMGTWAIQHLKESKCGLSEETGFDFFPFPTIVPTIEKTAVGPVDGIVATQGADSNVKRMLSFFAEPGPQEVLAVGAGGFAPSREVRDDIYSPLRLRILQESRTAKSWAFNYDLATPTEVADRGLDSFSELLAFPDQEEEILTNLQMEVNTLFNSQKEAP